MEYQKICEKVKEVLASRFELGRGSADIADNEVIFDSGIGLDSMSAVELVVGIEEAFGLMIEDEDLQAKNFDTVDALARLVDEKLSKLEAH